MQYHFKAYPKYFNHASVFLYQDIVKESLDYAINQQKNNNLTLFDFIAQEKEKLIDQMRTCFKLSEQHICFGLSVSQFMAHFVWGYSFKPKDAVVVLKDDYPSLTLPWKLLAKKGPKYCALDTDLVAKDLTVLETALKTYRPKFFACSAVHNIKGIRWPLYDMACLCKQYGVYFIVDATQALGVLDVNWDKINPDVLLANTYKWLMWPMGLGFMACSDSILKDISPVTAGARSVAKHFVQSNPSLCWAKQAQAFESGAINLLSLSAACYLLNVFSKIGFKAIETKSLALANHLRMGLTEKNYQLYPIGALNQSSQIISVDAKQHYQLFEYLSSYGYRLIERDGFVRLSPAFYQSHEDIEALLNLLKG